MSNDNRRTWVYGVVPAGAALKELEKRRDRLPEASVIEMGDLGAIVGDAPDEDDAKAIRDQALAHAQVLEAAVVDAPVVPMRFGTVVEGGDDEVGSQLLEARRDDLSRYLNRVKDHVQLVLKVNYDEETVLREILENQPDIKKLWQASREGPEIATRDARARLGELIFNTVEQLRQRDSREILEQLKSVVVAGSVQDVEKDFMVLNVAFLIERDGRDKFDEALEKVASERSERMHFTLQGPMPAYDFIEQEEPAWA
jgi:hypothetical protein